MTAARQKPAPASEGLQPCRRPRLWLRLLAAQRGARPTCRAAIARRWPRPPPRRARSLRPGGKLGYGGAGHRRG